MIINPEITRQLKEKPRRKVSLIISVPVDDAAAIDANGIPDAQQRSLKLDFMYWQAKQPFFQAISDYAADGLKIVDQLAGTPSFIAIGPANTWLRMLSERSAALPEVELTPNTPDWSTAEV